MSSPKEVTQGVFSLEAKDQGSGTVANSSHQILYLWLW